VHPSPAAGPIPTTAGEGGRVRAQQARRSPIRRLNFRVRVVRRLSFDASWPPGVVVPPASAPDRLGFADERAGERSRDAAP
jgi:hypothetical protein